MPVQQCTSVLIKSLTFTEHQASSRAEGVEIALRAVCQHHRLLVLPRADEAVPLPCALGSSAD